MASARCPFCKKITAIATIETRPAGDATVIRRRRRCKACGQGFKTVEEMVQASSRRSKPQAGQLERVQVLDNCKRQYAQLLLTYGAQVAENYLLIQAGGQFKEVA